MRRIFRFVRVRGICVVAGAMMALLALRAWGVSTSHWVQGNGNDFRQGKLHNVVVTNLGDVKLSRAIQTIQEQDPDVTSVNALAEGKDGTIYAGTGPKGKLLAVKDNKVSVAVRLDNTVNILSLLVDSRGRLLIGTGGEKGMVLRIEKAGDKPAQIFAADGVQYIWALRETSDGNVYAATGPNGQVFEIMPDGSHTQLYKSSENNITSMIDDGKDYLYLGTDPNGMVVRINRKTKESFILYNAPETEIAALALDSAGNLYAGTGQSGERQSQRRDESAKKTGRPEGQNGASPIPANPPASPPQPPQIPNPNPGEPKPIPKNSPTLFFQPGIGAREFNGRIMPVDFADNGAASADAPDDSPDKPGASSDAASGGTSRSDQAHGDNNAIYKIDKEGFVTEIFRQNAVIYSMVEQNNVLLVGTGNEGNIYQVNPAAEETVVLAKVDVKQVLCLLPARDGRIYLGLANMGGISAMTGGYATEGTYTSPVLDATQVSRFGRIQLHGQLPDGTKLKLATRSGNVKDADAPGWSKWSAGEDATEYVSIPTPSARFLQYRLTFSTTDPSRTAVVDHVDVAYQIPNLAPVIKSVKIGAASVNGDGDTASSVSSGRSADSASKTPGGTGIQNISWDASDPNNDSLVYALYFRLEQNGPWILLKDNLKDNTFDWDTKTVADGRYQVRVIASDALSNPPGEGKTTTRVSEFFVIDNTAPVIGDLAATPNGENVKIDLRVQDRTSIIAKVQYTVDSSDQWQAVLPVDNIYDSPDEKVSFTIKGLTAGSHQVTIRATDSRGNQSLQAITVKTAAPTARNN